MRSGLNLYSHQIVNHFRPYNKTAFRNSNNKKVSLREMSNIYIQEPPTSGKVLLMTTVGDIDIELWSRECPKTCRNFIQLCMEGYYNDTIFHRVVKGFIAQGGDPNSDGTGGESIYGHPFKDEFHSRLRYVRRGLVGMANSDKDDNGSQFFFTLAATPELQNKNTLFGKVTGDTIFNMLKLEEGLIDHNEKPMYPHKILKTEILKNPFSDIEPRKIQKPVCKEKKKVEKEKGIKNFGLLSFGEEAEEDEEKTNQFMQKNAGKAKSLHDAVDDPNLSKEPLKLDLNEKEIESDYEHNEDCTKQLNELEVEQRKQRIQEKLKSKIVKTKSDSNIKKNDTDSENCCLVTSEEHVKMQNTKKREEIRQEIVSLKKQYQNDKKVKDGILEKKMTEEVKAKNLKKEFENNELIKNFIKEKEKYENIKSNLPLKGIGREDFTLNLLTKFRSKLHTLKENSAEDDNKLDTADESTMEKEIQGDDWLRHMLRFQDDAPVLAKDASTKTDDWYDAYDPRNPLNKRKRKEVHNKHDNQNKSVKRKV
uniref:Spliceosome-associated protein CWC27 homolog n=1 Tax=Glossina brevipalpis TaxID=37001 RepID=A0A1A9WEA6_9MUSC